MKVTKLVASTSLTLRLVRANFTDLGIGSAQYGKRDYARTQEIGVALAFLRIDGLIAPSARWHCDNLMIYRTDETDDQRLTVIADELVDSDAWGKDTDARIV